MANCLYSGDKPLGVVQSNATDVEYSTGVSVKDMLDKVAPISLGSIANNETKTLTIPNEILENGGIYLLSFLNSYGAGGVYLLKRNTTATTPSLIITALSASQYLTLTSVDSKSLTVTASGVVIVDTHILRV